MNIKNSILLALTCVGCALIIVVGSFYYKYLRGIGPALRKAPGDIVEMIEKNKHLPPGENKTDVPLVLPDGFEISIFASDIPNVRDIALGPKGNIWISQPKEGTVSFLAPLADGSAEPRVVWEELNHPHGLLFDPEDPSVLYIAEEDAFSRARIDSDGPLELLVELPSGGRHDTRTMAVDSEGVLLISIGSSCDTCFEEDARQGSIQALVPSEDGWVLEPYAAGLRNAVFMTQHPETKAVWATEMGRDFLGDDLPPDEVNVIARGQDYGWPICYGQNIHDIVFDERTYLIDPCHDKTPARIDLTAHVAPLGLAFIPTDSTWPEEYWGDLLVAYHGSWNRSEPVGYKIVRFDLDSQGSVLGQEDFISGWLTEDDLALGRPVDILVTADGSVYISDDKAGVVYRATYTGPAEDDVFFE
jgi:glucose/arabinose dehydrogenase